MSKRPRRWLMVDTACAADLRLCDAEAVGAAFALVLWEAAGHEPANEDTMARVCGLSRTKWRKRAAGILHARDILKRASEPRATFRRPPLAPEKRARILARDGAHCTYCGATQGPFHIDHIQPYSRGGTDDDDNLCVACAPCNFAKAASLNSEWTW